MSKLVQIIGESITELSEQYKKMAMSEEEAARLDTAVAVAKKATVLGAEYELKRLQREIEHLSEEYLQALKALRYMEVQSVTERTERPGDTEPVSGTVSEKREDEPGSRFKDDPQNTGAVSEKTRNEGSGTEMADERPAKIIVVGVGGAGVRSVERMKAGGMRGVEFLIVDSDLQALLGSDVENQIQIGETLTGGLGAGMDPELGRRAAEEARDRLLESLHGADLVFVVAGLGGGTGSGAAPVVAACAQQTGALTVGVVAKPSLFEGKRRAAQADSGISNLRNHVDALVVFPRDHLLQEIKGKSHTISQFRTALAEVLPRGVRGITDLITAPGLLNVTAADVKKMLAGAGIVSPGLGTARGDNASVTAAKCAVTKAGPGAARSVILNVTGGKDLSLYDATRAADIVAGAVEPEAGVLFGVVIDETLEPDEVRVSCYFIQGAAG